VSSYQKNAEALDILSGAFTGMMKKSRKIFLSMWLLKDGIDDEFRINSQEIDTQYFHGASICPERYIKNIIEHGSMSGYFSEYIERLEYTYKCFDKGNEFYSQI